MQYSRIVVSALFAASAIREADRAVDRGVNRQAAGDPVWRELRARRIRRPDRGKIQLGLCAES